MMGFALVGYIVVGVALAVGIYWMATNLTFKQQPERYTYKTDEDGNDTVKDNTDGKAE